MQTELHFHLLPGVDDGPPDDASALDLARAAVADGTRRVVATPHVRLVAVGELPGRVRALRGLLAREAIALEVRCGGELSPDDVPGCADAELELIAHGPESRRWVLVEAPLAPCRPDLISACTELRGRGYRVLIGHPERSPVVSTAQLEALVADGSVLQLNASSLVGRHGARAAARGLELARSGLPFVVASDAHSPSRPPLLTGAAQALAQAGIAPAVIREAMVGGPSRLLRDGLPDYTVAPVSSSRSSERRSSLETCIWE